MTHTILLHTRASAAVVRDCAALQDAHGVGGGKIPKRGSRVWAAYTPDGRMAAYATAVHHRRNLWLRYCVVATWARGHGLQARLLDARVAYAAARGYRYVITYTCFDNWPSYRNLTRAGFVVWYGVDDPEASGGGWVFWWRLP